MQVIDSTSHYIADVKCYHCGHITGQMIGYRGVPLKVSNFRPRPGYAGPELKAGTRLLCERCGGPVYLEESATPPLNGSALTRTAKPKRSQAA